MQRRRSLVVEQGAGIGYPLPGRSASVGVSSAVGPRERVFHAMNMMAESALSSGQAVWRRLSIRALSSLLRKTALRLFWHNRKFLANS